MGRVTLVDTSVWIDFLRRPLDAAPAALTQSLSAESAVLTEPIEMELLAGPTDDISLRRVENLIGSLDLLRINPDLDFHEAAKIYRAVRRNGQTVRNSVDCLIAAVAIRHDVVLLHKDADFEAIAQVTELRHHSLLAH